jgi:hypothetical protein
MNTTITVTIQVTRGEGSETFTADASHGPLLPDAALFSATVTVLEDVMTKMHRKCFPDPTTPDASEKQGR